MNHTRFHFIFTKQYRPGDKSIFFKKSFLLILTSEYWAAELKMECICRIIRKTRPSTSKMQIQCNIANENSRQLLQSHHSHEFHYKYNNWGGSLVFLPFLFHHKIVQLNEWPRKLSNVWLLPMISRNNVEILNVSQIIIRRNENASHVI